MSNGLDDQAQVGVHGVYFLFKNGSRPSSGDISRFVRQRSGVSISFDPSEKTRLRLVATDGKITNDANDKDDAKGNWLELLSDGLTFDIVGLDPGDGAPLPAAEHRFDFDRSLSGLAGNAVALRPGTHISSASGSIPVLKSILRLARDLVQHFEQIEAVVWSHSESVIGRRFFESTVTAYLEGGAFPALGLVAFVEAIDGGLQSVGLAHIIGQELRIEPDVASEKLVTTRLAVRLVNHLVLKGRVESIEEVVAPDGRTIRIEPSSNGRFVRVWSG